MAVVRPNSTATCRRPIQALVVVFVLALLTSLTALPAGAAKADKAEKADKIGNAAPESSNKSGNGKSSKDDKPFWHTMAEVARQVGADAFWAEGHTGQGVDIAIIDTGIAPVGPLQGADKIVVGPDLSFEGEAAEVAGLDSYGHGTHLAGIIAGRTAGDPLAPAEGDFFGIAPDARLISIKVADNSGAVDVSQVIAAIDWVVQHRNANGMNIRVLNLAYNTSSCQDPAIDPLSKAVENAWNHGIVVVTAAGNDGRGADHLSNPASNPFVIAVSSAEQKPNGKWQLPQWAPKGDDARNPDLIAPGASVLSLRVPGSRIDTENPRAVQGSDDELFLGSGTSQSAAVVSGAAALLLDQRPDLRPDQVKAILMDSALDLERDIRLQGSGVVDLEAALTLSTPEVTQTWAPATGLGSLEDARDEVHVEANGVVLSGEITVNDVAWDPEAWVAASESATAWSGASWSGASWSGASWSGASWSGASWSGASWSGASWSGASWSGASWSGASWSGASWSGASWSGASWS